MSASGGAADTAGRGGADCTDRAPLPWGAWGAWGVWGARTYVMGIVNCTPDSFSGDGLPDAAAAIAHGMRLAEEGADVLDVGGESTRPGAAPVPAEEELRRVLRVVEALITRSGVPVSVDTSKAAVADAALAAGATIVNDVWALARDPELATVAARHRATVVLMHNRIAAPTAGALGGHYSGVDYGSRDVVEVVGEELEARVAHALAAGIPRDRLVVDPGIGFGKTREQNLGLLRRLGELKRRSALADLPLLVGTSRKSVIGLTLGLPVEERLEGTLATLALAVAQGADAVRVHDVRAAVRCVRMADAIVREG
ncbi:MAG TPA: dihydropteroate synthase [Chloroflexota bacterium]|nr:dihydropteroate synthase [Chloroflexota bacterium]